ncbi:MAG: hypothetical protein HON27_05585 [Candidatus Marinimicrobia bacterium]|nr:hypothetical protein [Candidatus Neomarinimicrobiota bacterium]MBT4361004.1 hypothetical protein [Candidatus Neomarinimicrobiota bacterium]MBT4945620.1 hypothetical protein [Candidatus Neomarinimicrobiota bacterium]MBT5270788.1 hypothetical protein [Candidatus Neomarinimicrobiota bacterium]MBT6011049.1 hypothetical protein [Candidatus Neomarinimicrobiota bacterium]
MKKVINPLSPLSYLFSIFVLFVFLPIGLDAAEPNIRPAPGLGKTSAFDPVLNRARGYMSKGELQFATHNYGSFIEFDDKSSPSGLYKGYQYISDVSFILGVPGRDSTGAITPWALRPPYVPGLEHFSTDTLVYWGSTVSESWFDRVQDKKQVDWESVESHYGYLHSGDVMAGEIYGGIYTDSGDPYPLLASSDIPDSWPIRINDDTGLEERTWPGDWAVATEGPTKGQEIIGRHIGDQDIYMEFDDRLATRDEDMTQGYAMGMHVTVNAHSYGRSYAEDIAFFTVEIVNESYKGFPMDTNGDNIADVVWVPTTADDGTVTYELMDRNFIGDPDIHGFDYEGVYGGFYFDVDSYSRLENGQYTGRTNDDDMMAFDTTYDMAFIWDWDDRSSSATNLAYSALKLLDTPLASENLDIDGDGFIDIQQGQALGLTDWHWFDWYKRPGVLKAEDGGPSCTDGYAGAGGCPGSIDKENIMFALMAGDTSYVGLENRNYKDWEWRGIAGNTPNPLNSSYSDWYFHPSIGGALNPHFDSLEGLLNEYPDGLDCVFMMSAGPFNLAAGDTTHFSFAVIMGDPPSNTETFDTPPDLAKNAEMAQIMYDLKYQGFSPPDAPTVSAVADDGRVTLYWDSKAETSKDIVTGIEDFEGYKIYRSTDGGSTWGNPHNDVIYNTNGQAVGWTPLAQFDLTAEEDEDLYGLEYAGPDPVAPWFNLGENTGLEHRYVDNDVLNGVTYSYSVVAYDIGMDTLQNSYTNPTGEWDPLESLENFRGNSPFLPQFVNVTPDARPSNAPESWGLDLAPWTVGTGEVEVIPTNPAEVEVNTNTYFITIDAEPDCYPPNTDCNNPYYHLNPTYTVVDSATGDTVLTELEIGTSTMFSEVWGGFQFYLENSPDPSVDTVYWQNKGSDEAPQYNIQMGFNTHPFACDYEIRWDWENPNDDMIMFPNTNMPFRIMNTSFGEDLNNDGLLDEGEDINNNNVLDPYREVMLFVFSAGIPETSPDPNYPRFRSNEKISFIEKYVEGYDSSAVNTQTWNIIMSWDTTRTFSGNPTIRHAETGDVTHLSIDKPYEDGDMFTFRAASVTEMSEVTQSILDKVMVVPNPYIVTADWETDVNHKSLHFTHLPDECVIKIFTLTGELVYTILHNDIFSGQEEWNLRSMNRQEVAPGLYVFVVETPNHEKQVGKFAVIR